MSAVLQPPARRPILELPGELISQIAAGEVVERPASVVRELVDNALDAGATEIAVKLVGGGIRAIVIEDDGHGIPAEELPLALRRHATSKIASLAELEGVATMGFRGEALAAIAAIAELAIASRSAGAAHARRLDARSGEIVPAARGVGTSVEVRELFFATPARRKFLKSEATELAHCVEAVRRHALARPTVGFSVWHEGRLVQQWRRAAQDDRVADVLGAEFIAQSRAVDLDLGVLRIEGRAGLPEAARARADQQYVYVNGRHVRDRLIAHGVRSAYEDVLHGARQPAYVLFVAITPDRVDVNVHPTKIEVRFRDSREVHQAVRRGVEAALAPARAGLRVEGEPEAPTVPQFAPHFAPVFAASEAQWRIGPQGSLGLAPTGVLAARQQLAPYAGWPVDAFGSTPSASPRAGSAAPLESVAAPPAAWRLGRAIGQVAGAFVLAENVDGLVIVDMHAAHERIVYERLKASLGGSGIASQPLLIPATFAATADEVETAEAHASALQSLGLDVTALAANRLAVRAVPAALVGGDGVELARSVLAELARFGASHAIERAQHEILSTMACHGVTGMVSKSSMVPERRSSLHMPMPIAGTRNR